MTAIPYEVTWVAEIEAATPHEAAERALCQLAEALTKGTMCLDVRAVRHGYSVRFRDNDAPEIIEYIILQRKPPQ